MGPGMKIVAVNSRRFDPQVLRDALSAKGALELLVENGQFFSTRSLDYRGGEKYPILERDAAAPDVLSEILKPLIP